AELYEVKVSYDDQGNQVGHFYPTKEDGKIVGFSKRETYEGWEKQCKKKPELIGKMKKFSGTGNTKPDKVEMFGQ
ncbi:MAG: hypothetical protein GWN01_17730, partial [Nitrosopumilaceae archaeon]|nr:hypothetical protein [Nitrosopumilaceae archaeon]NIU89117.1 hypothetical protein [Nitrosopumilaceae archaeon]NIV65314.1 hypothetical protein [Nitrosopumilaceae archaeon]NIX63263.1 hypothetical protein [Nitrosopumilaceae archaeon]